MGKNARVGVNDGSRRSRIVAVDVDVTVGVGVSETLRQGMIQQADSTTANTNTRTILRVCIR